ncbi:MAG: aminopeptidase P N-terminal domain-containing protein [Planctomycetota bacterium]
MNERDAKAEIWHGRRVGSARAPEVLGVDVAYANDELWDRLPELLAGCEKIVYRSGEDEARDREFNEACTELRAGVRRGIAAPMQVVDTSLWLHELRLCKTESELERMRRAAAITAEAHVEAMRQAQPGVNEAEIDALLEYTFRRRGGTGAAYNNIVAGGANACILHYVENNAPLVDGDLLLIDAGCEVEYYASDVTRTFPVNGTFSPEQRAIYEVVLDAQKLAVAAVRPDATSVQLHEIALRRLVEGLLELGLLSGTVETVLESKSYERFFMHKTGHWLGLDVHDQGTYFDSEGNSRPLRPGMVLTVEPGLYVGPDDESVEARWRGIGVRIEDDVLVTESGQENLTASIPKEVEEVEAVCSGRELARA